MSWLVEQQHPLKNDNKILHNEAAHHVGLQDMKLKNMLENIINK
mgnify:CR=1 FL=1